MSHMANVTVTYLSQSPDEAVIAIPGSPRALIPRAPGTSRGAAGGTGGPAAEAGAVTAVCLCDKLYFDDRLAYEYAAE